MRRDTDPGPTLLHRRVPRVRLTSDRLQRTFREQGWNVTTEWGHGFERSALWSHLGPPRPTTALTRRAASTRKLIRFIRHHQKDNVSSPTSGPPSWASAPHGQPRGLDRQAPTGRPSTASSGRTSLPRQVPLQAQPVKTWGEHEITFSGRHEDQRQRRGIAHPPHH
ncbi:endo-alpha-N-acetylgalactosaminidase family protein [Streptomyces sp. KL116D]|uniref:endo-alpha-N-acetylgalactosaminidase family protein n=1 Tax=Streptomyces sp. KL116D TaxID=3045152 RepID=UPI003556A14A